MVTDELHQHSKEHGADTNIQHLHFAQRTKAQKRLCATAELPTRQPEQGRVSFPSYEQYETEATRGDQGYYLPIAPVVYASSQAESCE